MAQTLTNLLMHIIFGAKDGVARIRPELDSDLRAYRRASWGTCKSGL
jgi:hypothetical protein